MNLYLAQPLVVGNVSFTSFLLKALVLLVLLCLLALFSTSSLTVYSIHCVTSNPVGEQLGNLISPDWADSNGWHYHGPRL